MLAKKLKKYDAPVPGLEEKPAARMVSYTNQSYQHNEPEQEEEKKKSKKG